MTTQGRTEESYVLGHSPIEERRLSRLGQLLYPSTKHLFERAGIVPGMKVLDFGCGAGNVSLLLAELIGPTGSIVGVTDPEPREALAALYRKGAAQYKALMAQVFQKRAASSEQEGTAVARLTDSGQYLIDHLHEVPVHVIPCIWGRRRRSSRWPIRWVRILSRAPQAAGVGTALGPVVNDLSIISAWIRKLERVIL